MVVDEACSKGAAAAGGRASAVHTQDEAKKLGRTFTDEERERWKTWDEKRQPGPGHHWARWSEDPSAKTRTKNVRRSCVYR